MNDLFILKINNDIMKWVQPSCYGDFPIPRWKHTSTLINKKKLKSFF